jgi:hypothetical protein
MRKTPSRGTVQGHALGPKEAIQSKTPEQAQSIHFWKTTLPNSFLIFAYFVQLCGFGAFVAARITFNIGS